MTFKSTTIAAAASLLLSLTAAQTYSGDGTFYGAGGDGAHGMCLLQRGFNRVGITAALNRAQIDNGLACGRCVKVQGTGQGIGMTPIIGPIYATIDNECSECKYGDIDLGLGGDGRWQVTWEFIDCNEARAAASNLPVVVAHDWKPNPALRGAEQQMPSTQTLSPGQMMTPEGIKSMNEYLGN